METGLKLNILFQCYLSASVLQRKQDVTLPMRAALFITLETANICLHFCVSVDLLSPSGGMVNLKYCRVLSPQCHPCTLGEAQKSCKCLAYLRDRYKGAYCCVSSTVIPRGLASALTSPQTFSLWTYQQWYYMFNLPCSSHILDMPRISMFLVVCASGQGRGQDFASAAEYVLWIGLKSETKIRKHCRRSIMQIVT